MGTSRQYFFGEFRLDAVQRALFRKDDELVSLTPKALETLLFLVEKHGRIVDKKELMDAVWPDTFVEEVSLARNVSVLRKTLSENEEGQSFIETIPKRGYRFVAPVREAEGDDASVASILAGEQSALPSAAVQPGESSLLASKRARWRFWAIASAIVIAVVAGLAYWLTASRPALSFANRDWILIADFENRTGDPRFDQALFTALTVSLEQSRYANIFPRSRVYETLQRMGRQVNPTDELRVNEGLGREICQRESLPALVATSLTRTGKQYLLVGRLVDPKSGVTVRSYTNRIESEDQILDALDALAKSIRQDLGETLFSIRRSSLSLPHVTTPSLSALQLYAEAIDQWNKGKHQDSKAQLQEALRIDPDFAMAHAALGNELYSHIFTEPQQGKQEYERALQLSGRVTVRERMFIEASFASAQEHTEEAVRFYRTLLELYPDDGPALFNLASVLLRTNRCNEAIAQYKELIRISPSDVNSRIKIATCYALQSKYKEALPFYSQAFELDHTRITSANLNHEYGFILVGAGQPEKAREVFALTLDKPEIRFRGLRSLGLLDLYEGRYQDGVARFKDAIAANQIGKYDLQEARNHLYLAIAYRGMGNLVSARQELQKSSEIKAVIDQAPWIMSYIGVEFARVGAPDEAAKLLEVLRSKTDAKSPQQQSELNHLDGEILLARGDISRAIQKLQDSCLESYPNSVLFALDGQGRAFERSGQPEKAISAYESFLAGKGTSPLGWEPQQDWLEDHYLLAKLDAAHGNTARATQLLDKLLAIWKNADPDLPLLNEAKSLRGSLNP